MDVEAPKFTLAALSKLKFTELKQLVKQHHPGAPMPKSKDAIISFLDSSPQVVG